MIEYKIVMVIGASVVHALAELERRVNEALAEGWTGVDLAHVDLAPGGYVAWKEMGRYDYGDDFDEVEPEPEPDPEPEVSQPEPAKRSTRKTRSSDVA